MKAVMISIQPKWVELIADGEKTIEARKTRPKLDTPFKCYIYCTQGGDWLVSINGKVNKPNSATIDLTTNTTVHELNGKVIGEFVCDRIEPIDVPYPAWQKDLPQNILDNACLTYTDLHHYIGSGNRGYAWHISDLVIYDEPKELGEFRLPCSQKRCASWCKDMEVEHAICLNKGKRFMSRPPQSWCYVEEKE